jgi:hypothetical protein
MHTDLVLEALRMTLGTGQPGSDVQLAAHTDQLIGRCASGATGGLP